MKNQTQNESFTQPSKMSGFTLIELLVVIAIIGILASVVLAALNTARDKGTNASIQSNISGTRAAAGIYFSDAISMFEVDDATDSVCLNDETATHKGILRLLTAADAANGAGVVACNDDPSSWAAAAQLIGPDSGDYFCADSTGFAGVKTGTVGTDFTTDLVCP